jgi:copper chaperone CopZ
MKTKVLFSFLLSAFLIIGSANVYSQENVKEKTNLTEVQKGEKNSFKVWGNCGMCENRIEKAALGVEGVNSADWDKETKMLKLTCDASKTKVENIHKAIAKVGHDTDKAKADDEVYSKLPGCCKYDRK